jgi:hypothetical protein
MKEKNRISGDEVDGNEDEQREKLRDIANKIDTDQDGKISRDEMRIYVEQRVKFVLFYVSKKNTNLCFSIEINIIVKQMILLQHLIQKIPIKLLLMRIFGIILVILISNN